VGGCIVEGQEEGKAWKQVAKVKLTLTAAGQVMAVDVAFEPENEKTDAVKQCIETIIRGVEDSIARGQEQRNLIVREEEKKRVAIIDPTMMSGHFVVVANTPTVQVDLNESSLLNAMISIRTNFKDIAGLKMFARGRKLIIPPALEPVAIRLTKTELRPGTADNDVNAIHTTAGGLPEGYMVMDFLTSSYAWFLLTNIKGLVYMERVPYEMDMQVDFTTDNLLVKGYERYSFGYYNWRSIFGSFPTS
jgi:phage major head subunit gpT-like protein